MIICVCNKASKDCDKVCAKGRILKPKEVYNIATWKRSVSRDMESAVRLIDLEDMKR